MSRFLINVKRANAAASKAPEFAVIGRSTPRGEGYVRFGVSPRTPRSKAAAIAAEFDDKGWVWLPTDYGFVHAKLISTAGGVHTLETVDKRRHTIADSVELVEVKSTHLRDVKEDLVKLEALNIPLMMYNLKERAKKKDIYTNVGSILIAVNPFEILPIYTPLVMESYRSKGQNSLPPHPFAIADESYRALHQDNKNQCILVSGESGAGKTETTKVILQYLAEVAGSSSGVEQKILMANPILESFGNAKTLRNNNSSRFGKWVEIAFDGRGHIVGASIINYLLEKSRVTYQASNERGYHIFYELLAGADAHLTESLGLKDVDYYNYTKSSATTIEGVDDKAEFDEVWHAFHKLGFTDTERFNIVSIVAAILHLGNVQFEGAEEAKVTVATLPELEFTAKLLGISVTQLSDALTKRTIVVAKNTVTILLKDAQAVASRDSLARHLYGELFNYLVKKINSIINTATQGTVPRTIGVLDIFGFELFDKNSFEQLCINFANEKLQQKFNQSVFKEEMALYQTEEVPTEQVTFEDNQPVLDLIEKKPTGIFSLLDEELLLPKATDATYLEKISKAHAKTANFEKPVKIANSFTVKHYAGNVTYDVENFIDKNKDQLFDDLVKALSSSTNTLVVALMAQGAGAASGQKRSLSWQFTTQLNSLMATINSTTPHYIRCVKPNVEKQAASLNFDTHGVLKQLNYAGVFEAVSIRRRGYPYRLSFEDFWKRYSVAVPGDSRAPSWKAAVDKLFSLIPKDFPPVKKGKTMVFYRQDAHDYLERLRTLAIQKSILKIQALWRGRQARAMYKVIKGYRDELRAAIAVRSLEGLEAAIGRLTLLDIEIKELVEAKKILEDLKRHARLGEMIATFLTKVGTRLDLEIEEYGLGENISSEATELGDTSDKSEQIKAVLSRHNARIQARLQIELALSQLDEASLDKLRSALRSAEASANLTAENDPTVGRAQAAIKQIEADIETRDRVAKEATKAAEANRLRLEEEARQAKTFAEVKDVEVDRLQVQIDEIVKETAAIAAAAQTEDIEIDLDDLSSLDEAAAEAVIAAFTPLPDTALAALPPSIVAAPDAPKIPTITIPIFASPSGNTILSPRVDRGRTARPAAVSRLQAHGSLRRGHSPSPSPSPRIVIHKTIITEEPPNPEKDAIYEALLLALSVPPHPLLAGVTIEGQLLTLSEDAKAALRTANQKASAIKTQDLKFQQAYQTSNLLLMLRHYYQFKEWRQIGLQLQVAEKWRPAPLETPELTLFRQLLDQRDLNTALEAAYNEMDVDALQRGLEKAQQLGTPLNLPQYQTRLNELNQIQKNLVDGLATGDPLALRNGVNGSVNYGQPASLKTLTEQAYGKLYSMIGSVTAQIKGALVLIPTRAELQDLHQKAHLVGCQIPEIAEIEGLLALDDYKLCERRLKSAISAQVDPDHITALRIELKHHQFERYASSFKLEDSTVLRDPERFASSKFTSRGRDKLRAAMLMYSKSPIPTSLTVLPKELVTKATKLFKNIQGFMGDRQLSYPVMLLRELLKIGVSTPELRDEIYAQLVKQLTHNPDSDSASKGWQVLLVCLMTFPPSPKFENYLAVWLKENGYSYHLKELHETVIRGGLTKTPSTAELIYVLHYIPPSPGDIPFTPRRTGGVYPGASKVPVRPTGAVLSVEKMSIVFQIVPQDNLNEMVIKELDDEIPAREGK